MDTTQVIERKHSPSHGIGYYFKMTFKTRMARFFVSFRAKQKKLFTPKLTDIDARQKSAIALFISLIKNKEASMNYSPESKIRYIESESVWITMRNAGDKEYLVNIIHAVSDKPRSHEIYIPSDYANIIMDDFDLELERRFRVLEGAKNRMVVDDLEDLIKIVEEESHPHGNR